MIKSKPNGECTGKPWNEFSKNHISHIYVATDESHKLVSVQFGYMEEGGYIVLSERFGGEGHNYKVVKLNYPSEYLTSVAGSFAYFVENYNLRCRISSISFCTNQNKYGPFGQNGWSSFAIEMGDDFYGFHGYSEDKYLRAIGVYMKPNANHRVPKPQTNPKYHEWI